jgi:hypothetical protein
MHGRTSWLFSYCGLALIACAGDTLAVGDVRCEGEGVTCEPPSPFEAEVQHLPDAFSVAPPVDVSAAWVVELPCPAYECMSLESRLVVHPDGSVTVARILRARQERGTESSHRGVSLARIAADGTVLWNDDTLIETGPPDDSSDPDDDTSEAWFRVALALDEDGDALLAVLRGESPSFLRPVPRLGELTVYAVGRHAGELARLFGGDLWSDITAVGQIGGELIVAGYYWRGREALAPNPELARYERDGTLVFRQTALRRTEAADLSMSEVAINVAVDVPLVIASDGNASVAVVERTTFGLDALAYSVAQVAPDGNVRWSATGTERIVPWVGLPRARLAIDDLGRVILGTSPYQLDRFAPEGEPTRRIEVTGPFVRVREQAWEPDVMGLDCDASNRVLVATQAGAFDEHRLIIDRLSYERGRLETFSLPELSANGGEQFAMPNVEGLRAGPDDSVYLWVDAKIARVDLP